MPLKHTLAHFDITWSWTLTLIGAPTTICLMITLLFASISFSYFYPLQFSLCSMVYLILYFCLLSASLSDSIMTTMEILTLMYSGLLHWSRQPVNSNLGNRFVNLVILLVLACWFCSSCLHVGSFFFFPTLVLIAVALSLFSGPNIKLFWVNFYLLVIIIIIVISLSYLHASTWNIWISSPFIILWTLLLIVS
jgi:hypothetical protein